MERPILLLTTPSNNLESVVMDSDDFRLNKAGNKLVIVFSSYGVEGTAGDTAFARPRFEFNKTLSDYNISCLFVKDRHQHWYHSGVFGLAPDIPSLAYQLSSLKSQYTYIATLGHSMGGYAALLFAAICNFNEAIATAPQTSILKKHRVAWRDYRWPIKIPETREESRTPEYFDIRPTLSMNPHPIYRCWYSSAHQTDQKHCQHIDGVEGVKIFNIDSSDHNAAKALRDCGILDQHLKRVAAQ